MEVIIVACSIIFAGILYLKDRDFMNPGTIFSVYWGLIVFLAALQLYGLSETSQEAYFMIFLGILFYFFGSLFGCNVHIKFGRSVFIGKNISSRYKYNINYKFFQIAACVVIIYSLYRISIIVRLLVEGNSWWAIRLMGTSGEGGIGTLKGGNLSDIIYSFIVSPIEYLIVPTVVVDMFVGKRRKDILILGVLATICYSISTVSRAVYAFAIIYVIVVCILVRKSFVLTKKQKKLIRMAPIIVLVFFLVINQFTKMRNSEADLLVNAYAYLSGAMPLLSIHLKEAISSTRTYGMLTFYGFLHPIFFVTNRLHILSYPQAFQNAKLIKANLETFISLGPNISMNAYATLFYDFYIDFGYFGVALLSALFGYLCMRSYKYYKRIGDSRSLVLYLLLLQFILFSMARIYTVLATRALSFVWLLIMFKKEKNIEQSKEF